jgi:enamine deaminase RidA (YjgF/YER057c/UK114 family)
MRAVCAPAALVVRLVAADRAAAASSGGYPAAHSPYSHAVVANGFVFVSGQISVRPGGGPTELAHGVGLLGGQAGDVPAQSRQARARFSKRSKGAVNGHHPDLL